VTWPESSVEGDAVATAVGRGSKVATIIPVPEMVAVVLSEAGLANVMGPVAVQFANSKPRFDVAETNTPVPGAKMVPDAELTVPPSEGEATTVAAAGAVTEPKLEDGCWQLDVKQYLSLSQ